MAGGYTPDGRYAVDRAREHTVQFKDNFGEEMPPRVLAERMGQFVHQFTCFGGARLLESTFSSVDTTTAKRNMTYIASLPLDSASFV